MINIIISTLLCVGLYILSFLPDIKAKQRLLKQMEETKESKSDDIKRKM